MMTSTAFEPSGQIKSPTAEELAEADKDSAILCYTNGILQDDRPYYVYMAVKPSRYKAFKEMTDAGKCITFSDYGEIIAAGFEAYPPPEVVQKIHDTYGFDEDFTEKLVQGIRADQSVFMEQQEKKRIDDIVTMLKQAKPAGEN